MAFIPSYILILFTTITIDYFAGIYIERSTGRKRKIYLIVSIVSTCLVLFVFKYFNFFISNFDAVASFLHWNYSLKLLNIILPIGLSFHTFQSLSYVIEVYRGNQKAENHFGIYSLYVMFYPQLVAGPIERPQNLLHQFYEKHDFNYQRVTDGLKLMLWGLFLKVVIADRLALFVNTIYDDPHLFTGVPLIIATVFFAFQIYCDFAGYSFIAIGAAEVMGFKLMDNFRRPYLSKSISEFWRRWHISLSTWFRDYLYIPLGGNRVEYYRWLLNIFIVFVVSGLWHGAAWTFVIWGALHGFYLIFSILTEDLRKKIVHTIGLDSHPRVHQLIQVAIVFALVSLSWIFFRANNLENAFYIITHLFSGWTLVDATILGKFKLAFAISLIIFMEIIQFYQEHTRIRPYVSGRPLPLRWIAYAFVIIGVLYFGVFNNNFIYFQF